jgi:hypothetical protein
MRYSLLLVVLQLVIVGVPVGTPVLTHAQAVGAPILSANLLAQDQPSKSYHVDINVGHGTAGRWNASPVWIAIGALALIVLVLLIVMAMRGGGGTTVVKD